MMWPGSLTRPVKALQTPPCAGTPECQPAARTNPHGQPAIFCQVFLGSDASGLFSPLHTGFAGLMLKSHCTMCSWCFHFTLTHISFDIGLLSYSVLYFPCSRHILQAMLNQQVNQKEEKRGREETRKRETGVSLKQYLRTGRKAPVIQRRQTRGSNLS